MLSCIAPYSMPSKLPTDASSVDEGRLFRKFCHDLKEVLSVNFSNGSAEVFRGDNEHQRVEQVMEDQSTLFKAIDPNGKLKGILEEGKISSFKGNVPVDEAQIVLLNDAEHRDKEQQLVRGEIANALQRKSNILLGESYDSDKTSFSPEEINHVFAPNLDESLKNLSSMAGWDHLETYLDNYQKNREFIALKKKIKDIKSENPTLGSLDILCKAGGLQTIELLTTLEKALKEGAKARTRSEWSAIQKFIHQDSDSVIFVFAGAGHNNDPWLLEQLRESNFKYCILTPKIFYDSTKIHDLDDAGKYYQGGNDLLNLGTKC